MEGHRYAENEITEHEINRIAYSTWLNRDAVRDELASIDCYLRTHERCNIYSSSPIYGIAWIYASFNSQSVLVTDNCISVSVYSLASIDSLANRYINTYEYINTNTSNRDEWDDIRSSWIDYSKHAKEDNNDHIKRNDYRSAVHDAIRCIIYPFILLFSWIGNRLHILSNDKSKGQ